MPSKRRGREQRHEEVLVAAARVIARRGYRRATLQDVGAELDMTGAALYYYVESKEDLLVQICLRAGAKLHRSAEEILAQDLPPLEKLRLFFRRHLEVTLGDRAIFSILIQERSEIPEARREELLVGERAYFETARTLIRDVAGDDVDSRLVTFAMMGMLNWVMRWYRTDGDYRVEEVADAFSWLFLRGVEGDGLDQVRLDPEIGLPGSAGTGPVAGAGASPPTRARRAARGPDEREEDSWI